MHTTTMTSRRSTTRRRPALLGAVLLATMITVGGVGAAGIAQAQPSDQLGTSRTAAPSTRGFWIDNLTTKRLRITKVLNRSTMWDNLQVLPAGYVIEPGEIAHTELDAGVFDTNHVVYQIDVLDVDGSLYSRIDIGMFLNGDLERYQAITGDTLAKPGAQPVVSNAYSRDGEARKALETSELLSGQDLDIYDAQGTTLDATTLSAPQQGRLIQNFCAQDLAHCDFVKDDVDGVPARSAVAYIGDRWPNDTCDILTHRIDTVDRRSTTHSWEFSASVKTGVKDVWEAQFTAKYGGSVTNASDFTASQSMSIRPGFIGYFASTVPVHHHTGTWFIKTRVNGTGAVMTAITVHGSVDIPDTSGSKAAEVTAQTDRMTDQERAVIADKCKD